jgi:hypothetical protein
MRTTGTTGRFAIVCGSFITIPRVLAVVAAVAISNAQFQYFDCNETCGISFVSGVVTLLAVYATAELLYRVLVSADSDSAKLQQAFVVAIVGCGLVASAGFFTMLTHVCP